MGWSLSVVNEEMFLTDSDCIRVRLPLQGDDREPLLQHPRIHHLLHVHSFTISLSSLVQQVHRTCIMISYSSTTLFHSHILWTY